MKKRFAAGLVIVLVLLCLASLASADAVRWESTEGAKPAETVDNLFDLDLNTKWCASPTPDNTFSVRITYDAPFRAGGCYIATANDAAVFPIRNPEYLTIYGANGDVLPEEGDGAWELILNRMALELDPENNICYRKTLPEALPAYRHYWVKLEKSNRGMMQISELALVEADRRLSFNGATRIEGDDLAADPAQGCDSANSAACVPSYEEVLPPDFQPVETKTEKYLGIPRKTRAFHIPGDPDEAAVQVYLEYLTGESPFELVGYYSNTMGSGIRDDYYLFRYTGELPATPCFSKYETDNKDFGDCHLMMYVINNYTLQYQNVKLTLTDDLDFRPLPADAWAKAQLYMPTEKSAGIKVPTPEALAPEYMKDYDFLEKAVETKNVHRDYAHSARKERRYDFSGTPDEDFLSAYIRGLTGSGEFELIGEHTQVRETYVTGHYYLLRYTGSGKPAELFGDVESQRGTFSGYHVAVEVVFYDIMYEENYTLTVGISPDMDFAASGGIHQAAEPDPDSNVIQDIALYAGKSNVFGKPEQDSGLWCCPLVKTNNVNQVVKAYVQALVASGNFEVVKIHNKKEELLPTQMTQSLRVDRTPKAWWSVCLKYTGSADVGGKIDMTYEEGTTGQVVIWYEKIGDEIRGELLFVDTLVPGDLGYRYGQYAPLR